MIFGLNPLGDGGRAILYRDELVLDATTAATLWYVIVMGLCFGGGQIGLGLPAPRLSLLLQYGFGQPRTLVS